MLLPVADGIATRVICCIFYFNLSSEMLARTSSHTCGRWYLPTFLFRDGPLTLMYMACLIALIWFKSSLPTILKLDKDPMLKQSGVIYRYHCDRVDCDEEYIGESSRTFGERFKEHLKPPSPIYDHSNISGHNVSINNFKIVGREDLNQMRAIKQAIYIRVNGPSLNRNVGKYHLPHVWDEVLANISELKLK